jgi:hypothetical protein
MVEAAISRARDLARPGGVRSSAVRWQALNRARASRRASDTAASSIAEAPRSRPVTSRARPRETDFMAATV